MMRRIAGTLTLVIEPSRWPLPVLHSLGTIPAKHPILRPLLHSFQSKTAAPTFTRLGPPTPLGRGPWHCLAKLTFACWIFSCRRRNRSTQVLSSSTTQLLSTWLRRSKLFLRHQFFQLP